jgi:predicted permease
MRGRSADRAGVWLGGFLQDVRQTLRGLRREPRFAVFVVLTLALGLGANSAMYGVADRLFLSGPPEVRAPEELVRLYLRLPNGVAGQGRTAAWIPYRTALAIQEGGGGFTGVTLYRYDERLSRAGDAVRTLRVSAVDGRYFGVLGPVPAAGRFFGGDPTRIEGSPAVISHELWLDAFGGRPGAVGEAIELAGETFTVVGVAPEGFSGPHVERVDAWVPLVVERAGNRNWQTLARLPPGRPHDAALAAATAEADAIHHRTDPGRSFQWAVPGTIIAAPVSADDEGTTSAEASVARLLLAVMGLVLLIAAANVVNLLLARMTRRHGEVVVRLALGIGRRRLARLLLTESVSLALLGGLASVPVAWVAGRVLRGVLLPQVAWSASPLDLRLLAMTGVAAVAVGVVVGLLPARQAGRTELTSGLAAERIGGGRGRGRSQAFLAVAQVTLSAALLMCAGLFLRSFWTMRMTDLGVEGDAWAVTLRSLDDDRFAPGSDGELDGYQRALSAARSLDGFQRSSLSVGLPFLYTFGWGVFLPGRDSIPELPGGGPFVSAVSGGYFEALGTPVLRGNPITDEHVVGQERVMVVGETMARSLWPRVDAMGQCVRLGGADQPCFTVIGVVGDAHRFGYREPPSMQLYVPRGMQGNRFSGMTMVVRPDGAGTGSLDRLRSAIRTAVPEADMVEVFRIRSLLEPEIRPWRLGAVVLGVAAGLALLVSVIGVYGVVSYLVAQRRREIGVRIALGASARAIRVLVLRSGTLSGALGVGAGVALVLAASRWIEPLLYETAVSDVLVIAGVAGTLVGAALLACLLPARQAARVDPVTCLRGQG